LAKAARHFASTELHLPQNGSYSHYADIGRPFAVWNVIAAPRFSVQAKQWCFIFVGCISYRGYHSKKGAEAYAQELRKRDYDVMVAGARAYSTLGWFDDPLLNTMLYDDEARLVGIIIHELAHQKIYVEDFSAFNEAFASAVEIEGVLRWFRKQKKPDEASAFLASRKKQKQFNHLLRQTRAKLKILYRRDLNKIEMARQKQSIFKALKQDYGSLTKAWGGDDRYDKWMAQDINNAHLALVGTYFDYVPYFRALFKRVEGDFAQFYVQVERLTERPIAEIKQELLRYSEAPSMPAFKSSSAGSSPSQTLSRAR